MTTLVVVTGPDELDAAVRAADAGAFASAARVLLLQVVLDPVPEVVEPWALASTPRLRPRFDDVLDLGGLVAPQHPLAWDHRDLAEGGRVRSALAGVERVVRVARACALRPTLPVLPLLLPDARTAVLVADALDLVVLAGTAARAGGPAPGPDGAPDEVVAAGPLAALAALVAPRSIVRTLDLAPGRDDESTAAVVARRLVDEARGDDTERRALLRAAGVLTLAHHEAPHGPSAGAVVEARVRLATSSVDRSVRAWAVATAHDARRRRAERARWSATRQARRVRAALRRRVERIVRTPWERAVLRRAARDVHDPQVVATTRRAAS